MPQPYITTVEFEGLGDPEKLKIPLKYSEGVLMPSPFSRMLAGALKRHVDGNTKTALDMGTGCGIQAIVLARLGVPNVLAVDIDPKCVAATEFNALLNDVSEWDDAPHAITALVGDMFAPLANTTFDFIVSNPPTLPHSGETPRFADGGEDGREFLTRLFDHSATHLRKGGKLCFIQSSLADIPETRRKLEDLDFNIAFESPPTAVEFRDFYFPHLYFYRRRKFEGRASYEETAEGKLIERLQIFVAVKQ